MKIVATEEHFATPEIMEAWRALPTGRQDIGLHAPGVEDSLYDLGDSRIGQMDVLGVDVQVLSVSPPGVQNLDADLSVDLAREANNAVASTVRAHPDRFQGFATLPTPDPRSAGRELERAVVELGLNGAMLYGRTGDRNLDHSDFLPVLEAAAALRAPLYLHPQSPVMSVRSAYYGGFGPRLDSVLATAGIGWHYDAGIQALRLVLSGVFDRLPDLQLILGHWGEVVLFYLDRLDLMSGMAAQATGLKRPVSDYFRTNFMVTAGGLYSQRYLNWAKEVLGADRLLFAADYPYVPPTPGQARSFIAAADLQEDERLAFASGNWDRLCAAIRR